MNVGHTFRSLEEPPNYFGCHIHVALVCIISPVFVMMGFLILDIWVAVLLVVGSMAFSASVFMIGAYLGRSDPYWVEGGQQHLLEEENYLDV